MVLSNVQHKELTKQIFQLLHFKWHVAHCRSLSITFRLYLVQILEKTANYVWVYSMYRDNDRAHEKVSIWLMTYNYVVKTFGYVMVPPLWCTYHSTLWLYPARSYSDFEGNIQSNSVITRIKQLVYFIKKKI